VIAPHRPSRLTLDGAALVANWRWLQTRSGAAACGAAVKADGYGLGADQVVRRLAAAGCRDFFVATWAEAEAVAPWIGGAALSVLHGLGPDDPPCAARSMAKPVLCTPEQVKRWREIDPMRPCDVMVDTGMNRLGLDPREAANGLLDGLEIDTLMSHLASADEDVPANTQQRDAFVAVAGRVPARRRSLANSAGICLGSDYRFELTRPGLALYGGVPRAEAAGHIRPVVRLEAQIVQRRVLRSGEAIGYNATFRAARNMEVAILNLGYADGYLRGFSGTGQALLDGRSLPVVGRVSMDLTAICVDAAPQLGEGAWVELDFDLPSAAAQSGLSQYELLTTIGRRHARHWT
jgi:alanine racemase